MCRANYSILSALAQFDIFDFRKVVLNRYKGIAIFWKCGHFDQLFGSQL
jgi:hypothetical protein